MIATIIFCILLMLVIFVIVPARVSAGIVRIIIPGILGTLGLLLFALGRPFVGVLTFFGAALVWRALSRRNANHVQQEQISSRTVRSAAFEMEYSHSGDISNGVVLAGRFEGRVLDDMSRADLLRMREEIDADVQSLELLDAYLDGRFPTWREDTHFDGGAGQ